jgi:hypothetical protein
MSVPFAASPADAANIPPVKPAVVRTPNWRRFMQCSHIVKLSFERQVRFHDRQKLDSTCRPLSNDRAQDADRPEAVKATGMHSGGLSGDIA